MPLVITQEPLFGLTTKKCYEHVILTVVCRSGSGCPCIVHNAYGAVGTNRLSHKMKIPNYQVQDEIGRGATSYVYRAIQDSLNRPVALKVMMPGLAQDEQFSTRFLKEGQMVASLAHPNIVKIYDIGIKDHQHYMAMELLDQGSLKDRLQARQLDYDEIFTVLRGVTEALNHAHQRGVLHRDVKPANILFRDNGTPVLSDFGIAKALNGNTVLTAVGAPAGTPRYMSPEQAMGKALDGRADQYSLGIVLYECLTGQPPYDSHNPIALGLMHIEQPIPQLEGEEALFQPLLNRLMAKDPEDRFARDADLLAAIDALEQEMSEPDDTDSGRPRSGFKWLTAAGVLVLIGGAVVYLDQQRGQHVTVTQVTLPGQQRLTQNSTLKLHDQQAQIAELLAVAEEHMQALRLTIPINNSALSVYKQVLALDPTNQQARAGLQRIADKYLELARQRVQRGQYEASLERIRRGLEAMPDHAGLKALRRDVDRILGSAERQDKRVGTLSTSPLWALIQARTSSP